MTTDRNFNFLGAAFAQDSFLAHARTAYSMCSGAMTAEMARAVLQHHVRKSGFDMDIRTVAVWDSRIRVKIYIALTESVSE